MTTEEAAATAALMLARCGEAERAHVAEAIERLANLYRSPVRLVVDNTAPPPPCDTEAP